MSNTHSLTTGSAPNAKRTGSNFTAYGAAAVTVECWVKTSTTNSAAMLVNINDGTVETFQLIKTGTSYKFTVKASSVVTSPTIAEGTIEDGAWHHLAGVYDGSNVRIYLDGTEQGSGTALTGNINTSNPSRLGIGVRSTGVDLGFVGEIDEVRVWNDARTATEINDNKDNCGLSSTEAGLRGWWKLDNNDNDSQTNITANNLVSVGTPSFTTDVAFTCDVTIAANTLSATFTIPASSVSINEVLFPTTLSATFSIPAYTVDTPDVQISASTLSATFSIPTFSVITDSVIVASTLSATFSIPTFAVSVSETITATTLTATFSIPTYNVDVVFNVVGAKITPKLSMKQERVKLNKY